MSLIYCIDTLVSAWPVPATHVSRFTELISWTVPLCFQPFWLLALFPIPSTSSSLLFAPQILPTCFWACSLPHVLLPSSPHLIDLITLCHSIPCHPLLLSTKPNAFLVLCFILVCKAEWREYDMQIEHDDNLSALYCSGCWRHARNGHCMYGKTQDNVICLFRDTPKILRGRSACWPIAVQVHATNQVGL